VTVRRNGLPNPLLTERSFDMMRADNPWTTPDHVVDNRQSSVDTSPPSVEISGSSVDRPNHHI
jgi:hypothetical protein